MITKLKITEARAQGGCRASKKCCDTGVNKISLLESSLQNVILDNNELEPVSSKVEDAEKWGRNMNGR
jgi:hypothetical protein